MLTLSSDKSVLKSLTKVCRPTFIYTQAYIDRVRDVARVVLVVWE